MKVFAIMRTRYVGLHAWPDAPEEQAYLRSPHRHVFHVKLCIEQPAEQLNGRNVEYHEVLARFKETFDFDDWSRQTSCEFMAADLCRWAQHHYGSWREVSCRIMEDGENGAKVIIPGDDTTSSGAAT